MLKTQVTPWRVLSGLLLITLVTAVPMQAESLATMHFGGSVVSWEPLVRYDQAVLTVSGPAGVVSYTFTANETPFVDLASFDGPVDGSYTFELRLVPLLQPEVREMLQAARLQGDTQTERDMRTQGLLPSEPLVQSGYLIAQGGQFVVPGDEEEPAGALQPRTAGDNGLASAGGESLRNVAGADQVILDDLIVDGSACIGFDCVNGENFGFDTLRLKENNTRIKFDDTSNSGSFPSFDWQLTANDSSNGGANKFSIEDITSGRVPFTIEGSAPTNSLYVDDGGRIGAGTSTPVVELHIVDGDTPTVRLEQDGSSGFTAQTWDLAGNETNFFVRDVTNGSKLPFKIRPNAPTGSLVLTDDGDILMRPGSTSTTASAALHLIRSDGSAEVRVEDSGTGPLTMMRLNSTNATAQVVSFTLDNTAANLGSWELRVGANGTFFLNDTDSTGSVFQVNALTGLVTIPNDLTVNGTFSNPSSRTLKTNIEAIDRGEILQKLATLPINRWTYISDERGRRHIGPFTEDFRNAFGLGTTGKNIIPLDVQGVTIAALQGLYDTVTKLQAENARLQERVAETATLENRVAGLEALLTRLVNAAE